MGLTTGDHADTGTAEAELERLAREAATGHPEAVAKLLKILHLHLDWPGGVLGSRIAVLSARLRPGQA